MLQVRLSASLREALSKRLVVNVFHAMNFHHSLMMMVLIIGAFKNQHRTRSRFASFSGGIFEPIADDLEPEEVQELPAGQEAQVRAPSEGIARLQVFFLHLS